MEIPRELFYLNVVIVLSISLVTIIIILCVTLMRVVHKILEALVVVPSNTVVPPLRGHPSRQRKVASQKGWPLKRGITISGSQLDMARFEPDIGEIT